MLKEHTMNRLVIAAAAAAAAAAVSVPAVAGLASPSSSHRPPAGPAQSRLVSTDDHAAAVSHKRGSDDPASTRLPGRASHGAEPGDDRGVHAEPGDDRGVHAEPGDDRGVHAEPGDDRGGHGRR
jgi:hypothetical protein